jgi:hypothetical protein
MVHAFTPVVDETKSDRLLESDKLLDGGIIGKGATQYNVRKLNQRRPGETPSNYHKAAGKSL